MAKKLWKYGTGNYPNNAVNYLLNTSPMHYVNIPEDSKEMRLLWQSVTRTLPPFIKDSIEMVFDEQFTLKQTAMAHKVSATTVRRIVRRLHSWLNTDGFAMQQLYNYAAKNGWVYTICLADVKEAWKLYMDHDKISDGQAVQFYNYLESGLLISECSKLVGVRTAILMRLYQKAIEIRMHSSFEEVI